jgi:hypothetical protein
MLPKVPPYVEFYGFSVMLTTISGGWKNLTTFLTTPSPLPHHPAKNLTTFDPGGEVKW